MVRIEDLKFDDAGLVPVVVQDVEDKGVVMVAFANREAIERTLKTSLAHYYSRSRDELWQKGVTSGNTQRVIEIRVNCENNSLLYLVERAGPGCHTGEESCFYRQLVS